MRRSWQDAAENIHRFYISFHFAVALAIMVAHFWLENIWKMSWRWFATESGGLTTASVKAAATVGPRAPRVSWDEGLALPGPPGPPRHSTRCAKHFWILCWICTVQHWLNIIDHHWLILVVCFFVHSWGQRIGGYWGPFRIQSIISGKYQEWWQCLVFVFFSDRESQVYFSWTCFLKE